MFAPEEFPGIPTEELRHAELIAAAGLCATDLLREALRELAGRPGQRLGDVLVRRGAISAEELSRTLRLPSPSPTASHVPPARVEIKPPPEVAAVLEDPSRRAGKYVRLELLGRGGMGEVWKAWDLELGRWAALKFLLAPLPEEIGRFRQEALTLAGLTHSQIATVYETGEAGGVPFLALQYVPGRPLAPELPVREAARHVRDAALAVHHAHERGIVHRDLKPANLLVVDAPPEPSRVVVLDFGLARSAAVDASLSRTGVVLGTPAYMSPEQVRGESARLDGRTDVYSLGVTLYELASGRVPFSGPDPLSVLRRVLDQDPPQLRVVAPAVDRDLETVVMKCLEKEPDRRYASARELADDLTRWLAGDAVRAHPPSVAYRLKKLIRRHRGRVAAGAATVLAVGLALGLVVPRWLRERRTRQAHERTMGLERAAAAERERRVTELAGLWNRLVLARQLAYQPHRTWEEVRRDLEPAVGAVAAFLERHPGHPEGLYVRAMGRLFLDDPVPAEADLREAVARAPDFHAAWSLLGRALMERHRRAGYASRAHAAKAGAERKGLAEEAVAAIERGRRGGAGGRAADRAGLPRTEEDAINDTLVEAFYLHTGRKLPDVARDQIRRAHERRRAGEYAAWLAFWSSDLPERLRLLDEALQLRPHYLDARVERGYARLRAGQARAALEDFDEALTIRPDFPPARVGRSRARYLTGDPAGAEKDLDEVIAADPGVSEAWTNRSALKLGRGDWAGTVEDATRAIGLDPASALAFSNRGAARSELRDYAGAAADFARAVELQPRNPAPLLNRSLALLARGDGEGAERDAEAALRLAGSAPDVLLVRAKVRLARGRAAEARKDLERALRTAPATWTSRSEASSLLKAARSP